MAMSTRRETHARAEEEEEEGKSGQIALASA